MIALVTACAHSAASPAKPAPTAPKTPRQRVQIEVELSNVEATLALCAGQAPSAGELKRFGSLPATKALLEKAKTWNLKLTGDDLWSLIQRARAGETKDVFRYDDVFAKRGEIQKLTDRIRAEKKELETYLSSELSPFVPKGKELRVQAVFVLGGYSSGFTLGGANANYVGVHLFEGDFLGVRNMLLHEVFHNVQALSRPDRDLSKCMTANEIAANDVIQGVFDEGSAEFVADVAPFGPESPYNLKLKEHRQINANSWRYETIEQLIDYMVVSAAESARAQADPSVLTTILTDWNWNNPGYYYGYKVIGELVAAEGRDKLTSYLHRGAAAFFVDYLAMKEGSKGKTALSPRFREIVRGLDQKLATCPVSRP